MSAWIDADVEAAVVAYLPALEGYRAPREVMRAVLDAVATGIAARAWDEGYRTGDLDGYFRSRCGKNPYRADETERVL